MSENMEIERRFLLRPMKGRKLIASCCPEAERYRLRQYYLYPSKEGELVRYRRIGTECYKTIKSGQGLVRREEETRVPCEEFKRFRPLHRGREIVKDRYRFSLEGQAYELDCFRGTLKGLVILETEFPTVEAARSFTLPELFRPWLVEEVTEDPRFNNASLCMAKQIPSLRGRCRPMELCPWMGTDELITVVLRRLVQRLGEAAERLGKGEDPEALHDFRVALRRLRVWLGECRELWCGEWPRLQREYLTALMAPTGAARDLEVLVATLRKEAEQFSPKRRETLEKIVAKIAASVTVPAFLRRLSQDPAFANRLRGLGQGDTEEGFCPEATAPAEIQLTRLLRRRVRRVRKLRKTLMRRESDRTLHRLRIAFKKLRYLMEESRELADPVRSARALKLLKEIQDLLGEYHDLTVERPMLRSWCRRACNAKEKKVVQKVRRKMKRRRKELRSAIEKRLSDFDRSRQLFEEYFYLEPSVECGKKSQGVS